MEDDFDVDAHAGAGPGYTKERFGRLVERLRAYLAPNCLPMSSGACTICKTCTYPDAPCRFPDRAIPSMEAYGLFVSRVCEQSGMEYCYGPRTLTYTACVLFIVLIRRAFARSGNFSDCRHFFSGKYLPLGDEKTLLTTAR